MNQNLSESRTWMKAVRWLALGLVFAVGGCCYSCRTKDSPVAEERFSHAEGFLEEEAFTESEGFLKKNRRQLPTELPKKKRWELQRRLQEKI